ncbi:MAG: hypothetical protein WEA80_01755 [Gemmatimonadaceae bacterium]
MANQWICDVCERPIPENAGSLEVFNANPKLGKVGSYPIDATADAPPSESDNAEAIGAAIMYLGTPANIGFRAICSRCPDYENSYSVALSEVPTIDRYVAWIFHLQEKAWIGHTDTMRMLQFWWEGRGLKPPHL